MDGAVFSSVKPGNKMVVWNPLKRRGKTIPRGTEGVLVRMAGIDATFDIEFTAKLETGQTVRSRASDFGHIE
jgi:hypothetical protein